MERGGRGGRGGGGRGYQGGGGGGRGRGPPPRYVDAAYSIDPYTRPYNATQLKIQQQGFKPYDFEKKEDVVIQKYVGKPGTWGARKINISVNHFPVISSKDVKLFAVPTLYHYDIGYIIKRKNQDKKPVEPAIKPKGKKSSPLEDTKVVTGKNGGAKPNSKTLPSDLTNVILAYLIPKLRKDYKHEPLVSDGCFNMYSTKTLEKAGIPTQHEITFGDLKKAGLFDEDDEAKITIMFEASTDKSTGGLHTIDTSLIAKYFLANKTLKGFPFTADVRCTLEAACNAIVRSMPNFQYMQVGRSTMIPYGGRTEVLGGGIAAWRGISANISMGWKPYLNVDIANCAFMLDKPVLEVLREVFRFSPPEDFTKWSRENFEEARNLLKSCKVGYEVNESKLGGPIRDVFAGGACVAKFEWKDKNKEVSVYDYFKERYGITLKHKNGPVLRIRNTSLVPAELCIIKKGQSYNRKLDATQTTNMLKFSKRDPADLHNDIQAKVRDMKLPTNKTLQGFQMGVSDRMVAFETRVLPAPMIRYGTKNDSSNQIANMCPEDGTWEIWGNEFNFYKPVTIESWGVLVVGSPNIRGPGDERIKNFCQSLTYNAAQKGVKFIGNPKIIIEGKCRKPNSPVENSKIIAQTMANHFKDVKLLLVVIPVKGDPLYGAVKHAAEIEVGILTQCVVEKNVSFCKDATVQNIILKINSKLGGINHVVVPPYDSVKAAQFTTLLQDCPVLILGADVTHAAPGSNKVLVNGQDYTQPSFAAVTGSMDKTGMPFSTEVRAQRKPNAGAAEVINDLEIVVKSMLQKYKQKSGFVPQKILYFRDGVGEGQFPEVLHTEMIAMRKACFSLKETYQPKITFITVQKRHKTRIFHYSPTGKIENAPAGTVIDKEIVHTSETDFFLLSHKGMLGTSRPCRYHVLWDDSDFSHDLLQSLAYTLCYMYIRCTKSVKMPACTYYAHLAADHAKKLCEGFEMKGGVAPTDAQLNKLLERNPEFVKKFPMHFV